MNSRPHPEAAGPGEPGAPTEAGGAVATWGRRLVSLPMTVRMLLSVALVVGVGALDMVSGNEVSFSIFYLAPVSFASAVISRRAGLVLAVLAAATWGYIDVTRGHAYSAGWIPYWNTAVRLGFFLVVIELIERLRRAHASERAMARTDSLTGIANLRVFMEHTEWVIALSRRSGRPFTIGYVDLDGFKKVNDTFGHSEGDALLREVATLIAGGVRATDFVARLGGDEFGILMPDTGAKQAQVTLERVATATADNVEERWAVAATIGAVTFIEPPDDVDSAVRRADALMYQGKAEGGRRIVHVSWPEVEVGTSDATGSRLSA